MLNESLNFLTRHSKKFKENKGLEESREYPGLTMEGVRLARETSADKLKPMIDKLPEKAVMAIIGASDAIRTKSTAQIYGDELKKQYHGSENVIIKTKEEILPSKAQEDLPLDRRAIEELKKEIEQNPDKKFVLDFPLFIKEFSMKGRWVDKDGNLSLYCQKLLGAVNNDDDQAVIKWVETDGEIDGIKGPKPLEVARLYKQGFERLKKFVETQISDRPVFIGGVGHSWDLDVFIAYMTHNKIDEKALKDIMGENAEMIQETEEFYFNIEDGKIKGRYRDQDYEIPLN